MFGFSSGASAAEAAYGWRQYTQCCQPEQRNQILRATRKDIEKQISDLQRDLAAIDRALALIT